jgi:hypothetical protein
MISEAFKEAPDAVEQVDESVVIRTKVLGRLVVDFTVTREIEQEAREKQTTKRRPIPPMAANVGGKA